MSSPTRLMVPNDSNKLKEIENVNILFQSGLEVWNTNDNSTNNNNDNNINNNMTLKITNSDLTPISLLDTLANLASLQSPISSGQSNGSPNSKQPHNIFPFSNNNSGSSSSSSSSSSSNTATNNGDLGHGAFTRGAKAAAAASAAFASSFSNSNSNGNDYNSSTYDDINIQNSSSSSSSSNSSSSSVHVAMDLETNNYQYNSSNTTNNLIFPVLNRRARAMSEPWLKSMPSSASMIEGEHVYDDDDDNGAYDILPQMMEHYRTIYNKHGRIGIYTRDERNNIIARFHEKRKKRVWKKKIRYHCRKNLADRRIRIKGRFVKAEDMEVMGLIGSLKNTNDDSFNDNDMQIDNNNNNNKNKSSNSAGGKRGKGKTKPTRRPPLPPKSSTTTTTTSTTSNSGVNPNIQFDINEAAAALEAKHNSNSNDSNDGLPPKRMRRHSIAY